MIVGRIRRHVAARRSKMQGQRAQNSEPPEGAYPGALRRQMSCFVPRKRGEPVRVTAAALMLSLCHKNHSHLRPQATPRPDDQPEARGIGKVRACTVPTVKPLTAAIAGDGLVVDARRRVGWEGAGCDACPIARALPVQLLYDGFNTMTVQFLFYLVYVILFQLLIFNLRSPDEYYMSKNVFVSQQRYTAYSEPHHLTSLRPCPQDNILKQPWSEWDEDQFMGIANHEDIYTFVDNALFPALLQEEWPGGGPKSPAEIAKSMDVFDWTTGLSLRQVRPVR